jgi:hypothetical protein
VNRRDAPTVDQLLNLADRAEDGPLSPAEAARLREGLRLLAHPPRGPYRPRARETQTAKQVAALARTVQLARSRGAQSVPVYALTQILVEPVQTKENAA